MLLCFIQIWNWWPARADDTCGWMPSCPPFLSQDWPLGWGEAEAGQQGTPAVRSRERQCQEPDPYTFLPHPSHPGPGPAFSCVSWVLPCPSASSLTPHPYPPELPSLAWSFMSFCQTKVRKHFCNGNAYLQRIFETSGPGIYSGSKCGLPELFWALFLFLSDVCPACVSNCVCHTLAQAISSIPASPLHC